MQDVLSAAQFSFGSELNSLFPALDLAARTIDRLQSESQSVGQSESQALTAASTHLRDLKESLETAVSQSTREFAEQLSILQGRASKISTLVDEAELLLTTEGFQGFDKLQEFTQKVAGQVEELNRFKLPEAHQPLSNGIIPPFERITITIPHFLNTAERFVYSEVLKAFGGLWRAQIFPAGRSEEYGGYLGAFLELIKGPKEPMKCVMRFLISHARKQEWEIVRECRRDFSAGDSWGWDDGFEIAKLAADRRFFGTSEEELTVAMEVRPVSYKVMYERVNAAYERIKARGDELERAGE
jgi:hypothetical protein